MKQEPNSRDLGISRLQAGEQVKLQPVRREKKCRACQTRFVPTRPLQVACCPDCAQVLARRNREKAEKRAATIERQKTRAALEALKTIPQLMAGSSQQYAAIEIGHEAARLNAVLSAQISEVRREVARMGLKAEDE